MTILQPPGWPRPHGYSNGIAASGRMIFTAGIVGWDEQDYFTSDNLLGQFSQILRNIVVILDAGGARPEHLVRLTIYVLSIDDYLQSTGELSRIWREIVGDHYPAMALIQVPRLVEPDCLVEIEATAVVPE